MLSDEECMKFRQMPGSFNEMVRAIYAAGLERAATICDSYAAPQSVFEAAAESIRRQID